MQIQQVMQLDDQLKEVSEDPQLELEILLCHLLQKNRSFLFTWPEYELTAGQQDQLEQMLGRRRSGEPLAHITTRRGFWTFDLEVSPATLIPRPDTELLVELALALSLPADARVADLGTGTGAIALALASERPGWQLVASDYIADAVQLAERNRQRLGLENVSLLQGSWFEPHSGRYHLIVSNPPYIEAEDPHLQQGDLRFEPRSALVADDEGLADIARISADALGYLEPGGWLMFEHGYQQGEAVRRLLQQQGYDAISTEQDLAGHDRVTAGRWPSEKGDSDAV